MPTEGWNGERRRHPRYRAKDGLFLVFRPDFQKIGQVCDMSKGGVAVEYTSEHGCWDSHSVEIDIFTSPKGIHLSRIPCRIVYDVELTERPSLLGLSTSRCGLQFGDIHERQRKQLETLLHTHTECSGSTPASVLS